MTATIENRRTCTCGRSSTGWCTGLHRLTKEQWDRRVEKELYENSDKQKD